MAIDPAFFIERKGIKMVLYGGLLQEAHALGLQSIDTCLVQSPGPDNGEVAICKATVTLGDGRSFSGIGDASDANTGSQIRVHKIRMSETRAKARALRDAINVNVVAFEEMGGEDSADAQQTASGGQRTGRDSADSQEASSAPERTQGGASRKAAGKLWHLAKDGYGLERLERLVGKEIQDMDAGSVSEWIEKLEGEA